MDAALRADGETRPVVTASSIRRRQALPAVLTNPSYHFKRIGLKAGPLSQWLFSALADAGLPAICVETRHMRAVLQAQINKTDRNDAGGIAQMMRAGLYRPVHVKTLRSQKLRNRSVGMPAGRDHAPHMGWHRVPLDPGRSSRGMRTVQDQIR